MHTALKDLRRSFRCAKQTFSVQLAVYMHSLVRVTRRVRLIGFLVGNFTLFALLSENSSSSARATFLLSVFYVYLAFGDRYLHFTLHYQARLLAPAANTTGLSPSVARFSKRLRLLAITTRQCRLPSGLFPVHSPLLRKSLLFSSPPTNDMLKFMG